MYKILHSLNQYSIRFGNLNIPLDPANRDYQRFIQDVVEQGTGIVEGPDVVEPSYAELRAAEYPSYSDQFDQIYHEGLDAWKASIQQIKDRYPKTITGGTTVASVPSWVQEAADNWTYDKQLREYVAAVERLELEPVVASEDIPETVEVTTTDLETMESTTETVRNPLIVKDEEQRAAAQAVVDATPQSVIDSINT
jgi:uncharacterized protein (UPF0335 family)